MEQKLREQIVYKIQHSNSNRLSKLHKSKVKLKTINTIDFYKDILYKKFKCEYYKMFYFVIDRTIQWYNKWYFDVNNLSYDQFQNKIKFEMCTYSLDLYQIYSIYLQQKRIYNLKLDLKKQTILQYLQQCYKKTTGYENLI